MCVVVPGRVDVTEAVATGAPGGLPAATGAAAARSRNACGSSTKTRGGNLFDLHGGIPHRNIGARSER